MSLWYPTTRNELRQRVVFAKRSTNLKTRARTISSVKLKALILSQTLLSLKQSSWVAMTWLPKKRLSDNARLMSGTKKLWLKTSILQSIQGFWIVNKSTNSKVSVRTQLRKSDSDSALRKFSTWLTDKFLQRNQRPVPQYRRLRFRSHMKWTQRNGNLWKV